ncbi:MAG: hypothetical protein BGO67_09020 [Alphaproteobacteria bacterium 41-28]|nr:MAG: hypothetical protein BGO67_09020 [Alphaproteobacteria bacterium 41-28]
MKSLLAILSFLSLISSDAYALKVYLLSNHTNAGDHNQLLGIVSAFEKLSDQQPQVEDLNTKTTSPAQIKAKIENNLPSEKVIVVGSGEGGIEGIKDLSTNPNLTICLTSHMFLDGYKNLNLLKKVNFIALPIHVSAEIKGKLGEKLIETTGVAHNRQPEAADQAFAEWGQKELPGCKTYLGVVLGGDAPVPGPSNDIKLFTEEDTTHLANYVAQNADDACILVLNGPRTGKYDPEKKEIMTVHRNGNSDRITELFQKELAAHGIENVKVMDFQHGSKAPYNSFDLALGAVKATYGKMIVPGEATSLVSEAIDTLPPGLVLVYENSAMNEVHQAHIASELAAGRVSVLKNYQTVEAPQSTESKLSPSAAKVIASKLWERVKE